MNFEMFQILPLKHSWHESACCIFQKVPQNKFNVLIRKVIDEKHHFEAHFMSPLGNLQSALSWKAFLVSI